MQSFHDCLERAGSPFAGAPDPALGPQAPQNDSEYVATLASCASESAIVEVLEEARTRQQALGVEEIEAQNFGYLAWRDCLARRGLEVPRIQADSRGNLVSYDPDRYATTTSSPPPFDSVIECTEKVGTRDLTASCTEPAGGSGTRRWSLDYEVSSTGHGFLMHGISARAGGRWTFTSPEEVWLQAEPAPDGVFPFTLSSRQVIARPPGGGCALVLSALASDGVPKVAVLGDSNTLALQRDLLESPEFGAPERSWHVVGESGGSWLSDSDIESSGTLDELRGLTALEPDVLVVTLGPNDALLWGVARSLDQQQTVRTATHEAIDAGLDLVGRVPCVLITGASEVPTSIFGAGEAYRSSAADLNDLLARESSARPNVVMTDWATESEAHHLLDGQVGDWFVDGDEIHLTRQGRQALVEHIERWMDDAC